MAAVQASAEVGQRAAAMRRDQLGVRITIEKARQDQPREGERGVDHEADRRRQTEFVEPHVGPPGGIVGWTNTGRPSRSISDQTGANNGSPRSRPRMLAS